MQAVIYHYLEQKGVQSPKVTKALEGDIQQLWAGLSKYSKTPNGQWHWKKDKEDV